MRPTEMLKIAIMAMAILFSSGTADAQRWRWNPRPCRVVTVVARPDVTVHVGSRFTQNERFRIAMAYLKNHDYLSVKEYAKMTRLSKAAAKAELDIFAADKDKPIAAIIRGKEKVYILEPA